jgi:nitrogenase molybdenum-iron protein beta chain
MSRFIEQPRFTCALAAQQTVLAIPGALPIVHAGPGCAAKIQYFSARDAGRQGEGYGGGIHISCTNSYEQEVVFGGEKKLKATVEGALNVLKGDLFVVLTGCTADIVGDDSVSVAREYASRGYPVVGVETAGFKGNSYYGHEAAVEAIIEQFVGDVKPKVRKGLVNVFSVVPFQDPFWRGDLENIKALLESIGLEVNILFGYRSAGVREWRDIPNAQFNLLLSPWVGLKAARLLRQKYGTPFLHYPVLPIGARETSRFLRETGAYAGLPGGMVEKVIEREEAWYYRYLVALIDYISEFRNNLPSELYTVADSVYGLGAASFLANEMGFILKGTYLADDPPENYRQGIVDTALSREEGFEGRLYFETDGGLIQDDIERKLKGSHKALFLGSNWEKFLSQKTDNYYAFLSLPLPETVIINKSYTGYGGGLSLVEEIYSTLFKTRQNFSSSTVSAEIAEIKEEVHAV